MMKEMALERLTREIDKRPGWQVIQTCTEYNEAKEALLAHEPDVCFMDINIIAGSGMELAVSLSKILGTQWIFSTAYSEFAVDAFDINASGYLLKPYENTKLRQLLHKVEKQLGSETTPNIHSTKLAVKSIGEVQIIDSKDIIWIKGASNYVELHCIDKMHLHRETLTNIENKLSKEKFVRVHRSAIVNIDYVKKIESELGRYSTLVLKNGDEVKISNAYKHDLFELLGV